MPQTKHMIPEDAYIPVLIVEDNAHLRLSLVLQLHSLGIKADSAANGMEALRRVHEADYCLILMDVQMPIMNGLEATAAIRNFEYGCGRRPVPIAAVTGGGSTKEQCLRAGMSDYVEKPMTLEVLRTLICRLAPGLLPE